MGKRLFVKDPKSNVIYNLNSFAQLIHMCWPENARDSNQVKMKTRNTPTTIILNSIYTHAILFQYDTSHSFSLILKRIFLFMCLGQRFLTVFIGICSLNVDNNKKRKKKQQKTYVFALYICLCVFIR